jgi:hypothetical protein
VTGRIAAAEQGRTDYDRHALLYRVYALYDDPALPADYQAPVLGINDALGATLLILLSSFLLIEHRIRDVLRFKNPAPPIPIPAAIAVESPLDRISLQYGFQC